MRDWTKLEMYLNKLAADIYPQPEDDGHTSLSYKVINHWMVRLSSCKTVLDVGAGTCFCQPIFENFGVDYTGVSLGEDFIKAKELGTCWSSTVHG